MSGFPRVKLYYFMDILLLHFPQTEMLQITIFRSVIKNIANSRQF